MYQAKKQVTLDWVPLLMVLVMSIAVAIGILVSAAHSEEAEEVGHRCTGVWTGNGCIGTTTQTDKWDSYHGDTYTHDGHVRQRPERRR